MPALLVLAGLTGLAQAATPEMAHSAPVMLSTQSVKGQQYLVLCYHSVPVTANGSFDANSTTNFAGQLAWLRANGYTAISMDDVLQARAGHRRLPAKSVMLTVDDGYEDFYINVFPLLKLYRMPAVLALVGSWIEHGRDPQVSLTDPGYASQHFVNWAQVREMADSGLVEMASHSFDLHHGILANPQGSMQPSAVTQAYSADARIYETPAERRLRVRADLLRNSALIERHTGRRPRIMVWPYGAMDKISTQEAAAAGMPINFSLAEGMASTLDIEVIPRGLIGSEIALTSFTYMVTHEERPDSTDSVLAIRVNLDRIYDPDPGRQDANLGRLLEQVARLGANTVLLRPFSMPTAAHGVCEAYFPNTVLPMRADLLNRVAWQFRSRLGVKVLMQVDTARIVGIEKGAPHLLDISDPGDRQRLLALYDEMSLTSWAQGLMFDSATPDAAQLDFHAELLQRVRYAWPLVRYYATRDQAAARDIVGLSSPGLPRTRSDRVSVPVPVDAPADRLQRWMRQFPGDRSWMATLSVGDADARQLEELVSRIALLQRHGITDFMVDDDAFLEDPVKLEMLAKAVSLKTNPFQPAGK
ncbi:poly-beta-1,6-N-acetyl-D-glucosamine N-deacetylase PgaB [Herbaspirillum sp. YR522]|uniref:poly-beta-1,6-N-acetyl-D-glucosamine N-deacetylase PgaB n=1 Tax=Herbaspirillum sp. YR522 TaxID=1144342 RepID=UPI0012FC2686|nr:poly-beta-1,6-N-acetyl-D-glucosamine N-deacetylase PgaB [Herbaspirillum sp. YR522]